MDVIWGDIQGLFCVWPSQWEMALHWNAVSHWLIAYTESLHYWPFVGRITITMIRLSYVYNEYPFTVHLISRCIFSPQRTEKNALSLPVRVKYGLPFQFKTKFLLSLFCFVYNIVLYSTTIYRESVALVRWYVHRADYRFAHSQWEAALLYNDISHWLCLCWDAPSLLNPSYLSPPLSY